ncbi:hypothetical protein NPIL_530231 [Nephila pilipes]|uniref:Uncharacterized protein n=1 Tax=Nephila pilipes TaxID=299642 RepID=A0A8X6MQX9_NEPPI|nr:hypothetical protein NPIL_530231 [Nephila pilipes]
MALLWWIVLRKKMHKWCVEEILFIKSVDYHAVVAVSCHFRGEIILKYKAHIQFIRLRKFLYIRRKFVVKYSGIESINWRQTWFCTDSDANYFNSPNMENFKPDNKRMKGES